MRWLHFWQATLFAVRGYIPVAVLAALRPLYRRWWQPMVARAAQRPVTTTKPHLPASVPTHLVDWRCNMCGYANRTLLAELTREAESCRLCLSSVRKRAIIHLLSLELFGESLALTDFPRRPDLRGLGLSDWSGYAEPLARTLSYTNTYYHRSPRLDITSIDPALEGSSDFLIATDVFEHVAPPVVRAFGNARRLLKPSGVMIFSVPFRPTGETEEHFPELHTYELIEQQGQRHLRNWTADGRQQDFGRLVFHGGSGATLEMRVFSAAGLRASLAEAGFGYVRFYSESVLQHGIHWPQPTSVPLVARITPPPAEQPGPHYAPYGLEKLF